mmetsp:Transcript_61775/g.159369  ORF Transcript_61775/g.159369 Transcript_61775/m.159369 type:complete len:210 (-) Transcript_61775:3088-3717(-)
MEVKRLKSACPPNQGMFTPPRRMRTYSTASTLNIRWSRVDSRASTSTPDVNPCHSSLRPLPSSVTGEAMYAFSKLKCSGETDSMVSLFAGLTVTNSKWISAKSVGFKISVRRFIVRYLSLLTTGQLWNASEDITVSPRFTRTSQKFMCCRGGRVGFWYPKRNASSVPLSSSRSGCTPSSPTRNVTLSSRHSGSACKGNWSQRLRVIAAS